MGVLRREFELSPAASLGILEAAKEHLFSPVPETAGMLRFVCASKEAKHGKVSLSSIPPANPFALSANLTE